MEWIKCNEKLPGKGKTVLVYCSNGYIGSDVRLQNGTWGDNQNLSEEVLYWMPLPNPPKMDIMENGWNKLSSDAKNVIEWVECPREGCFNLVTVQKDDVYRQTGWGVVIPITSALFEEIKSFVEEDENLIFQSKKDNSISFRFSDEYIKQRERV